MQSNDCVSGKRLKRYFFVAGYGVLLWEREATVVPVDWQAVAFNVSTSLLQGGRVTTLRRKVDLDLLVPRLCPYLKGFSLGSLNFLFSLSLYID